MGFDLAAGPTTGVGDHIKLHQHTSLAEGGKSKTRLEKHVDLIENDIPGRPREVP